MLTSPYLPGLDPARDTPVEILHTFLLGIIKYAWFLMHSSWKDPQSNMFRIRLASTDTDGLPAEPTTIRSSYLLQYKDNLVGRHLKTLSQTTTLQVHDLVDLPTFELMKAVGFLGAALWIPEIDDMDEYTVSIPVQLVCCCYLNRLQSDLQILIDNVLDAFDEVDPVKITQKMKIHTLTHIPSDVRRFGPAVRKSTEVFEKYNSVVRQAIKLENGQANSRDTAQQFSRMDSTAHLVTGGYYRVGERWCQAGSAVRELLDDSPLLQHHFGWVPSKKSEPGMLFRQASHEIFGH